MLARLTHEGHERDCPQNTQILDFWISGATCLPVCACRATLAALRLTSRLKGYQGQGPWTGALRKSGRVFARQCLDWSERRNHLAGALGSALADHLFELGWIKRVRESRAIQVTDLGQKELKRRRG
jgi:hypothetical protein